MYVELVNARTLKICLPQEDMQSLRLSLDTLPQAKRALWNILMDASRATGFVCTQCRLLVEVCPAASGCVVTYTRLPSPGARRLRLRREDCGAVFAFDDPNPLFDLCEKAGEVSLLTRGSALYRMGGRYYLAVSFKLGQIRRARLLLREFADECPARDPRFYREHGETLLETDALNYLCGIFAAHRT